MIESDVITAHLRGALLSDDWFRGCAPRLQDALIAHARHVRLQPGEHLFLRGTRDCDLYCVLSGSLCVQSAGDDGEMPVLVVLEPYHWLGELSFIDQVPRSHDAVADTEVTVLRVAHAGLAAAVAQRGQPTAAALSFRASSPRCDRCGRRHRPRGRVTA